MNEALVRKNYGQQIAEVTSTCFATKLKLWPEALLSSHLSGVKDFLALQLEMSNACAAKVNRLFKINQVCCC